MLWRSLVILITVFWLVMATLLVRVTYFPEGSPFAQMPPGAVLKLFLDRGASGKQLHLYHGERKIGHIALDLRRMPGTEEPADYMLLLSGLLEAGTLPDVAGSLNWRMTLHLHEGRHWAGASGQIRIPEIGALLDFNWREGRPAPEFTLHRRGVLQADDRLLQPLLGQLTAGPAAGAPPAAPAQEDLIRVSAREGTVMIAGQNRRGYVVGFHVMDRYRANAFFTEEGDLAVIDMPEGYRALEPNIHGLLPDVPDAPDAPDEVR